MANFNPKRTHHLLLFALLLLFSTGAFTQNTITGSFIFDGIDRCYRLYIPAAYDPELPVPLLFNLHGYGSNNIEQELYGDFRPIADTANFIIAHPNGTQDPNGKRFWNTFETFDIDDVGFLSALIDTISAAYNIDQNRIYSTGMSNGGFMSYDLACFLSDRITAVASVTGSMIWPRFNTCNATHPTPIMQIHGTADAVVPYNGNVLFANIDTLVNYWVQFNNCWPQPQIIQIPDIDTLDGCTAEQHIYSEGDAGTSVELFKVIGGGHSWPGAPINLNITNMDFCASVEIWRFFRQFSLDQLLGGLRNEPLHAAKLIIYPNPATETATFNYQAYALLKNAHLYVFNIHGQQLHSQALQDGQKSLELDVSGWNPGVYMLQIKACSGINLNAKLMVN